MPKTVKKKRSNAKLREVRDADQVIRKYEESDDTPGGEAQDRYSGVADRIVEDDTAVRRTIEAVGKDAVAIHGGDIDAGLETDAGGEEAIGGSNPTPDQDLVDEIGAGAGLTYADNEPLKPEKVERRDENRWELDPASSEDYQERQRKS